MSSYTITSHGPDFCRHTISFDGKPILTVSDREHAQWLAGRLREREEINEYFVPLYDEDDFATMLLHHGDDILSMYGTEVAAHKAACDGGCGFGRLTIAFVDE